MIQSSDASVQARLHSGAAGDYLWVVNPGRTPRAVTLTLQKPFAKGEEVWQLGAPAVKVAGNQVMLTVQDRNAAVVRLTSA